MLGRLGGIILAGGQGRRMGGLDKAFLTLAGRPLVAHAFDRLAPQVDQLAISANGDAGRFAAFGLPVLADEVPMGPLAGVLAGLRWALATGCDALLTVAVDSPFFPLDLGSRLSSGPAIAAYKGRIHPTFALWPLELAPVLAAELGQGKAKLQDFAQAVGARVVDFGDRADDPFRNLNTPADLAAAEESL